jgi:hypothetical protein
LTYFKDDRVVTAEGRDQETKKAALLDDFKIEDNRCKVTLNPGEKCEIVVRFMPSSVGNRRGTLQVSVDDRLATASLSGEGVGAQPQARRVWCCVNGKIEYLDARECQRREGESYPNEASARRGCRPVR